LVLLRPGEPAARAEDRAAQGDKPGVQARLLSVSEISTPRYLEATGTVRAELEAPVAARVMGRVASVMAREGDVVHRGQLLVSLDAQDLDAALAQSQAGLRSADVGYRSARVAAQMELATSDARIATAEAQVVQGQAAVKAAQSKLDLVRAGPRKQERAQAHISVTRASANLSLAQTNLRRYEELVKEGAISWQQYDETRTQYDVAKAQLETAQQAQSIADEGSRTEDIRAAEDGLQQAQAALVQARAGLRQAHAAALQVNVRRQDILGAEAQVGQSEATLRLAQVTRRFATVTAPFDGVVSARLADPGAMAAPGATLMRIQGGQIRLEAVVPESALRSAHRGSIVPVRLDAVPGSEISGTVVEVAPQGDPSSHTFVVKIGLAASAPARVGMFGRARFIQGVERRMLVPESALVEREGLVYVYVVDRRNIARLRIVTLGDRNAGRVQALSGLNPGEKIVASDVERLSDGQKVVSQ
jgi:RND family efflux transporter MFP subunit